MINFIKDLFSAKTTSAPSIPPQSNEIFSFTVQDLFTIKGRGTVATGKISSGVIKTGDLVTAKTPQGETFTLTVKGIEAFNKVSDWAQAGDTVGLLIEGVKVESVVSDTQLTRD